MKAEPIRFILNNVKYTRSGDGYSFKCPAHDDNRNSAYVKLDEDGNAILKCFAECSRKAICEALGIRERDLYVESENIQPQGRNKSNFEILHAYPYRDPSGNLLFEKLRMKQFKPDDPKCLIRRTIEGIHLWGTYAGWFEKKRYKWQRVDKAKDPNKQPSPLACWFDECPKVLYRLPELKSLPKGSLLLYVEGEKDVENAERLGFHATTAGSATSWISGFAGDLEGFDLVIIPDNDDSGRKCAVQVAEDCQSKSGAYSGCRTAWTDHQR
jgi:putative DNA primase/helicase